MTVQEMHYQVLQLIDKAASQARPDLLPNEIDDALNWAVDVVFKKTYRFLFERQSGFEYTEENFQSLAPLHILSPELQPALPATEIHEGLYRVNMIDLGLFRIPPYKHLLTTKIEFDVMYNNCEYRHIRGFQHQTDDKKTVYSESDMSFRQLNYTVGKSNLEGEAYYIDTRDYKGVKQYSIQNVYISYIKVPNKICIGTYKQLGDESNLNLTPYTECDLDILLHREIVYEASRRLSGEIQDGFTYSLTTQNHSNNY